MKPKLLGVPMGIDWKIYKRGQASDMQAWTTFGFNLGLEIGKISTEAMATAYEARFLAMSTPPPPEMFFRAGGVLRKSGEYKAGSITAGYKSGPAGETVIVSKEKTKAIQDWLDQTSSNKA